MFYSQIRLCSLCVCTYGSVPYASIFNLIVIRAVYLASPSLKFPTHSRAVGLQRRKYLHRTLIIVPIEIKNTIVSAKKNTWKVKVFFSRKYDCAPYVHGNMGQFPEQVFSTCLKPAPSNSRAPRCPQPSRQSPKSKILA